MSGFPTELWLHCLSFCDTPTLCAVCLTDRYFASLCRLLRFQTVRWQVKPPGSSANVSEKIVCFEELSKSVYAAATCQLMFLVEYWTPDLDHSGPATAVAQFLPAFGGITKLHLSHVHLVEALSDAILSLENLDDLFLHARLLSCLFPRPLRLRHAHIECSHIGVLVPHHTVPIADPKTLVSLTVADILLIPIIFAAYARGTSVMQLAELVLPVANNIVYVQLCSFLLLCPNLEILSLGRDQHYDDPGDPHIRHPLSASASTLLRLKDVEVLVPLADIFIPGRPVSAVSLLCRGRRPLSTLEEILPQSTAPIRKLSVHDYRFPPQESVPVFHCITSRFPELEFLSLQLSRNVTRAIGTFIRTQKKPPLLQGFLEEEEPGYRYDTLGNKFSPPPPIFLLAANKENHPMKVFINMLLEHRISLPTTLRTLHIGPAIQVESAEHAAILALEKICPNLEDLEFRQSPTWTNFWKRERNIWWGSKHEHPAKKKIVSRVWRADGTRMG
ncbi:hypothetical protein HMN09_01305100 [Mycena chlorophos]|uniref:F-box domain-containing protein n=1 Tax=Mycena chlorophos TaxID=658473 RepID=A0A8H6VVQ1_MYCCL|nr:hypothetical protein HMN09_01305100 [Mycena chlorophos]